MVEAMLVDNEDVVRGVPAGEDRVLVEVPDEIEEPPDVVDKRLPEDVVWDVDCEPSALPLPDVESVVLVTTSDEVDEKLLSGGTGDTKPDVTEAVTEGLPLLDVDKLVRELVPVVDEEPPLA